MIAYVSVLLCLISTIQAAVQINEFHYDNINADVNQFIEFRHTESLMGYEVILYNGFNGLLYNRTDLSNATVTTMASKFNYTVVPFALIANNVEGIALRAPNGTILEFISYEGQFMARNGPAKGMTSMDIKVSESNTCTGIGLSLQKCTNNYEGMWIGPKRATPGKLNRNCTASSFPKPGVPSSPCGTLGGTVPSPVKTPVTVPVVAPVPVSISSSVAPVTTPISDPVLVPTMPPVTTLPVMLLPVVVVPPMNDTESTNTTTTVASP